MKHQGAICFLVINKIIELPKIAIRSALESSSLDIYIGYTNFEDIKELLVSERIHLVDLSKSASPKLSSSVYQDFAQAAFYEIVQLKWELFGELLPKFDYLVYSDIDVIWFRDAAAYVGSAFKASPEIDFLAQSFTEQIGKELLCMGFVGMRNTPRNREFIESCKRYHTEEFRSNNYLGDDEVLTERYQQLGRPNWIRQLPQMFFPVGIMLNLYTTRPKFPGLSAPNPYIFHLNYVVGLRNKRIMLRAIRNLPNLKESLPPYSQLYWILLLNLKRAKLILGTAKKNSSNQLFRH
jgi:hypothetical protein